jgi:aspartyl-tRNA(Asn)/glutamyl-tRNA(Gln) amidotransferase subunit A
VRTLIRRDFDRAFEEVDVVASPTSPTVAFRLGERTRDPLSMYLADVCTIPAPLAGLPAISIPCGLSEGLPVGLQLGGPAFSENRLLAAAHALEGAIGFDPTPPEEAAR